LKAAFPPIVDANSKILILGSMPGEKSLELQQYYAHPGNQFWKILFTLFNEPFTTDYKTRIELLKKHYIALWDVLSHCERIGSSDSNIKNEIPNDFDSFYRQHPQIKHVFFDSKNVARFYKKHVGLSPSLNYYEIPSPSGLYASKSFAEKVKEWEIILDFI